jgi:hypothetical protein
MMDTAGKILVGFLCVCILALSAACVLSGCRIIVVSP